MKNNVTVLQKALGYVFKNLEILKQALTHKSYCMSKNSERLEFLGDSILNFVISNRLFYKYGTYSEGSLSQTRANMIKGPTLTILAKEFKLCLYLKHTPDIKTLISDSMLEDCLEAIIAAIYLDSDLTVTSSLINSWFDKNTGFEIGKINPKALLQHKLQAMTKEHPTYSLLEYNKIDGIFTVSLYLGKNINKTYIASGKSKKALEIELAIKAQEDLC